MTPALRMPGATMLRRFANVGDGFLLLSGRTESKVTAEPGAYLLVIELGAPLDLTLPRFRGRRLPSGCYLYCGSAYGPGGIAARVGRHERADKACRWHVDRLTAAGHVVASLAFPWGNECELVAHLRRLGASVPIRGFGSSDCRRCPAHLLAADESFSSGSGRELLDHIVVKAGISDAAQWPISKSFRPLRSAPRSR